MHRPRFGLIFIQMPDETNQPWPGDVTSLLDEHHLVVVGEGDTARHGFEQHLARELEGVPDSQLLLIRGMKCRDLTSFCEQLEAALHRPVDRSIDGVRMALQRRPRGLHSRYFIWRDADVMLEHDVSLFGRLANIFFAVGASFEHVSLDAVLIQRVIFMGGDKLGAYAEDEGGQFNSWHVHDDGHSTFWDVIACVDRPSVMTYRLDG